MIDGLREMNDTTWHSCGVLDAKLEASITLGCFHRNSISDVSLSFMLTFNWGFGTGIYFPR